MHPRVNTPTFVIVQNGCLSIELTTKPFPYSHRGCFITAGVRMVPWNLQIRNFIHHENQENGSTAKRSWEKVGIIFSSAVVCSLTSSMFHYIMQTVTEIWSLSIIMRVQFSSWSIIWWHPRSYSYSNWIGGKMHCISNMRIIRMTKRYSWLNGKILLILYRNIVFSNQMEFSQRLRIDNSFSWPSKRY